MSQNTSTQQESPLACNVGALDASERERYQHLIARIQKTVDETRPLENGYALRFGADAATVLALAEFVTLERKCCPFFAFSLDVSAEGGPVWLALTGREGVKAFIEGEFGLTP